MSPAVAEGMNRGHAKPERRTCVPASRVGINRLPVNRDRVGRDRGSVTAELAVLLPAVVLLLAAVMSAGLATAAQLRCVDAARTGARLAARAEPAAALLATVRAEAPAGASVTVDQGGEFVAVQVSAAVPLPLPGRPRVGVQARSIAPRETGGVR
jgi:hypothetical protein